MSTEVLSFNGRANIAISIVKERYETAVLVSAAGHSDEGPTTNPALIEHLQVVFAVGDTQTVIISETGYGEFGEPILYNEPYGGVRPIKWPVAMDLRDAYQLLVDEIIDFSFDQAGLVYPALPEFDHTQFAFINGHDVVFVDTITKKVRQMNSEDFKQNNSRLSIIYNLTYEISAEVTQPAELVLERVHTDSPGSISPMPPQRIVTQPGRSVEVRFGPVGGGWPLYNGTKGEVWYRATDSHRTLFKIAWDLLNYSHSSGSFTGGSANFDISGGVVDPSARSQTVQARIHQIGPTN